MGIGDFAGAAARAEPEGDIDMLLDSALVAGQKRCTNHHDWRHFRRGKCMKNQSYSAA